MFPAWRDMLHAKLKQDLLGLKYRFQEKGVSEHPAFAKLLEQRIQEVTANVDYQPLK